MKVKGTSVINTVTFVKRFFGPRHEEWMRALPPASQQLLQGTVLPTTWYPVESALIVPVEVMCQLFFGGRRDGAWMLGEFSGEANLTTVYKIYIKEGAPKYFLDRASAISQNNFDPCPTLRLVEFSPGRAIQHYECPHNPHWVLESRVTGFAKRGLELCGCKNVRFTFLKSVSKGDSMSEVLISWN